MSEVLLETNKGIVFERTATKNRCKVTVKNKADGFVHMIYRFNNGVKQIDSPYISWENLNCCGGWACDDSYLLVAVQQGKKLCSGINSKNESELNAYRDSLSDEYLHYSQPPMHNGPITFYYLDIVRKGAIRDYIRGSDVFLAYEELGIKNFNKNHLSELLSVPMIELLSGNTFDYGNPKKPEELITTGLLLGYPLESTAWLLERN